MTEFSEAYVDSFFDGNTVFLECGHTLYPYISAFELLKFRTDDEIIGCISLMGNNMCSYFLAIGEKRLYFSSVHYKFIGNIKIEERILLNATNNS